MSDIQQADEEVDSLIEELEEMGAYVEAPMEGSSAQSISSAAEEPAAQVQLLLNARVDCEMLS